VLLIIAFIALLASSLATAASGSFITNYSEFSVWLPVIMIAVIFSVTITGIYYIIGVVLQSKDIKSRAVGEFGQAVGTAVIVVALLGLLWFMGTSEFSLVSVLAPGSLSTVCGQLETSNVAMLTSDASINGAATPTTAVCSAISAIAPTGVGTAGTTDITPQLDYGLLASYVIMANVTNQAADNINAVYVYEGWMNFLSGLSAENSFCEPTTCVVPDSPEGLEITLSSTPMAGYGSLSNLFAPLETESWLTFYLLYMQLLVVILLLFAWPYLLAAGMILRATFLTRRAGGLLMAIAVSMAIIYPLMYVLEYSAFANLSLTPLGAATASSTMATGGSTTGAATLPNMPLYERLPDGNTITYGQTGFDFFILPNAQEVVDSFSCMPLETRVYSTTEGQWLLEPNLMTAESVMAAIYLIPGVSFATALGSAISGFGGYATAPSLPGTVLAGACAPTAALDAAFALVNLYGMVFVMGILIPVLNVMIAIGMIGGIGRLFGADTNILGIGKLL
jgi:hypothetical protein